MSTVRRAAGVAALAAALPLTACASAFSGYDLAPSGLPVEEDALRRDLAFQADAAYTAVVEGERALPDDDLLRLLYAGAAGRYAGRYAESSHLLDLAGFLSDDRVTLSVSRQGLSLLTSDRALAYVPGRSERLMIPYTAALNYIDAGDLQGAAVEARRIEALLDRYDDGVPRDQVSDQSRFLHYLAGAIFEAAGDGNAADVAYRRAGPLTNAVNAPQTGSASGSDVAGEADRAAAAGGSANPAAPGRAEAEDRTAGAESDARSSADARSRAPEPAGASPDPEAAYGDVVVLVEHGFVPHRVEQSVVIGLPASQVEALKDGDLGDKLAAAAEASARILLTASRLYGDRSGYYRDRGYQRPLRLDPWDDDDEAGGETPYLMRISWPVLYQESRSAGPVRIRAGELGVDAVARLDVADAARRDFDGQRAAILARTVTRAAAKLAITKAVEGEVEKKDETAAEVVGLITNLGTLLTERADTRCWHLLPGAVSLARLRLPPGTHAVTVEMDDGARVVDLGAVEVREGRTTFVSTRVWR